jgi:phenylpyruvate tautomerase PptA (4-oxalocrotonate tautomerase family)
MPQAKIFGLKKTLDPIKEKLSEVIHEAVMEALNFPKEKRFHRFICLEKEAFFFPEDRTEKYIIIEFSLFEGRTVEAKKKLIQLLFSKINEQFKIETNDIEITIFETPKHNWGIRGMPGDELMLNYKVNI